MSLRAVAAFVIVSCSERSLVVMDVKSANGSIAFTDVTLLVRAGLQQQTRFDKIHFDSAKAYRAGVYLPSDVSGTVTLTAEVDDPAQNCKVGIGSLAAGNVSPGNTVQGLMLIIQPLQPCVPIADGGTTGDGGSPGTGGTRGSGGTQGAGGSNATGGRGGSLGTGGVGQGGMPGSGGMPAGGHGGGTGGTGGLNGSGGVVGTGGVIVDGRGDRDRRRQGNGRRRRHGRRARHGRCHRLGRCPGYRRRQRHRRRTGHGRRDRQRAAPAAANAPTRTRSAI